MKSDVVMKGYRNQPDKTKETFTDDGWLRTGDIGEFDDEGFLKIVDRKKELIINAAGKNMSPANIEAKVKTSSPLIGQAICIGDARPYNVALITLDPDVAPGFAQQNGIEDASFEALAQNEKVREAVAGRDRQGQRAARARRADQEVHDPADRLGAGRRRADADDEAQAQADRREVQGGDRGALQRVERPAPVRRRASRRGAARTSR